MSISAAAPLRRLHMSAEERSSCPVPVSGNVVTPPTGSPPLVTGGGLKIGVVGVAVGVSVGDTTGSVGVIVGSVGAMVGVSVQVRVGVSVAVSVGVGVFVGGS